MFSTRLAPRWLLLLSLSTTVPSVAWGSEASSARIDSLAAALPASAAECTADRAEHVEQVAAQLENGIAEQLVDLQSAEPSLARLRPLLEAKTEIDRRLEATLRLRKEFAGLPAGEQRRSRARNFLRIAAQLIDLSGRVRYLLADAVRSIAYGVEPQSVEFRRLLDLLIEHGSSVGAAIVVDDLGVPPADGSRAAAIAAYNTKAKILELVVRSGQRDRLDALAQLPRDPEVPASLKILAAGAMRRLGLPQTARPGADPTLPKPEITSGELRTLLSELKIDHLPEAWQQRRAELLEWLAPLADGGRQQDAYRLGSFEVRPGDWLLMKNPSPYNRFTDLAPGLFTHVGVITRETGSDGRERMVLVDLPERGKTIRCTPIDTFVKRTLHYVILRHGDPAAGKRMGEVARSIIGNPSQFDLNFRTARVEALRGKPLANQKIHTYCAGLLLLCAQETGRPREAFFPLPEFPAGGNTVENLEQLGLTFGKNFISPTGALFSPDLQIVGRREPMYSPSREIEEAIFDHFAERLIERRLTPSPDLYQLLRQKIAEASRDNPLLAKALTEAANVDKKTDVVSAAKAAAVVETLDEIAHGASRSFRRARSALLAGPESEFTQRRYSAEQIAGIRAYRKRHARLFADFVTRRITPRELRLRLVRAYIARGKQQLDERYFGEGS